MRKRPRLAAILSILIPGLGQVWNRQAGKAFLFFVGYIFPLTISSRIGPMLWEAIRQGQELAPGTAPFWTLYALRGFALAIAIVVLVLAAVDAYRAAARE
jgi:hypothetical protein